MSELHERLAEISRLQGKDIPDGRSIMGDTQTPWPDFSPREQARPAVADEVDEPPSYDDEADLATGTPPPPSPLVRIATPEAPARPQPAPQSQDVRFPVPRVSLLVIDGVGAYQGHESPLSEVDQKQIAAVVLRAIQRTVTEKLSGLGAKRERRRPVKGARAPEVVAAQAVSEAPQPVKRRPGRPRKNPVADNLAQAPHLAKVRRKSLLKDPV